MADSPTRRKRASAGVAASGRGKAPRRKGRDDKPEPPTTRPRANQPYALFSWYGLMALTGFGFGLLADKRPFGEDILVHPLVMFFALVALSLLALRALLQRPVPDIISDRALVVGCLVGLAAFLGGNFVVAHLLPAG